ncbi:MAG: COX15/CtaA family protein [Myxococcota bacterium]
MLAWLGVIYLMILAMVIIGGITRLTGSGLSMVDWRPLMGWIPPMSEAEWLDVFARYRASPEGQKVNAWMELADFKEIFFWEYVHRTLGRAIGAVFLLPWLWFLIRRRMDRRLTVTTAVAFLLGGAQGLLGWFMVKSGLVDIPEVSHYRLASHLGMAFLVASWVAWIVFSRTGRPTPADAAAPGPRRAGWALLALLVVQIVWGAFMAGRDAGLVAPTFPGMNGSWIPPELLGVSWDWHLVAEDRTGVHFVHRTLGWLFLVAGTAWGVHALRRARTRRQQAAAHLVGGLTLLQFGLGAVTVVSVVAIPPAVAHQGVALLLLTAVLFGIHAFRAGPLASR